MAELMAVFLMPLLVLAGVVYFLPTLVAVVRGHPRALAIGLLNLLLGWTLLGWLAAAAWALLGARRRPRR